MTKPTKKKSHPSEAFGSKKGLPEPGTLRISQPRATTTVNPELETKTPSQKKLEREDLYKKWVEEIKSRINFEALSLARDTNDLFNGCRYLLQADFNEPGRLSVTIYILKRDPISPKKSHNDLRRERKIWLLPSFVKSIDAKGKEGIIGIDIVQGRKLELSVDPEFAFLTIDIETDSVPEQDELDRLFTRKPRKSKQAKRR